MTEDRRSHDAQIAVLEERLNTHMQKEDERFSALEGKIDNLAQQVSDLVDAWKTATNLVRFVKWLAGLGVAVAFFWDILKHSMLSLIGK